MSTVSTQVLEPSENKIYSAAQIQNMAQVDMFRDEISQAHATASSLNQTITNEVNKIQNLIDSRSNLVSSFKTDALAMYPELAGADMDKIMERIPSDHPLQQLWYGYSPKVDAINASIQTLMGQYDADMKALNAAFQIEKLAISKYQDFASTASTQVPSVEELTSGLEALQVIPLASEKYYPTVASLPAIETLDPEAADMVMMQSVDMVEADADAKLLASNSSSSGIKPVGIIAGLLGLAYIFFGSEGK